MCNFNVPFTGSAADFAAKIKNKIEGAGGTFDGDETSGTFSAPTPLGEIKGSYTIDDQVATVVITEKPFVISCNEIEEYVEGAL